MTGVQTCALPIYLPSVERWRTGDRTKEYDPNTDASRQEMRSMVCAQCHSEYYLTNEKYLVTHPWEQGLKAEQIEAYYDAAGFMDWTHAESGAPVLKSQHPEFETWSQGIHARSGVACADCHMPYETVGTLKISDHHVRSPVLNISNACQPCHHYPDAEIKARVEAIQSATALLLGRSETALVSAILSIKEAKNAGATDEMLSDARRLQRAAQWRTDFVGSENSLGFHAPQESARLLAEAIDYARLAELEAVKAGAAVPKDLPGTPEHPMPPGLRIPPLDR